MAATLLLLGSLAAGVLAIALSTARCLCGCGETCGCDGAHCGRCAGCPTCRTKPRPGCNCKFCRQS